MTNITKRHGAYCSEAEFVHQLYAEIVKADGVGDRASEFSSTLDIECEDLAEYLSDGNEAEALDTGERLFRVGGLALMKLAYDAVTGPGCRDTWLDNDPEKTLASPETIKAEIERIWSNQSASWDWADLKTLLVNLRVIDASQSAS